MASLNEEMGKSVLLEIFGDSPINRVLDFLIVFDRFDYSMADIAEKAGVSYSTMKILIKDLLIFIMKIRNSPLTNRLI